jgi:hypothetical protein
VRGGGGLGFWGRWMLELGARWMGASGDRGVGKKYM